jgi:hypothetical protein
VDEYEWQDYSSKGEAGSSEKTDTSEEMTSKKLHREDGTSGPPRSRRGRGLVEEHVLLINYCSLFAILNLNYTNK